MAAPHRGQSPYIVSGLSHKLTKSRQQPAPQIYHEVVDCEPAQLRLLLLYPLAERSSPTSNGDNFFA